MDLLDVSEKLQGVDGSQRTEWESAYERLSPPEEQLEIISQHHAHPSNKCYQSYILKDKLSICVLCKPLLQFIV